MKTVTITGFFHTFTDGHLLLVPESSMPFVKVPKKVLQDFESGFYNASPFYPTTVEVRIDADPKVITALGLDTGRRLVTVRGRVESRPSRGIDQSWIVAEKIVPHGDIADRAYEIHLSGRGASAESNWLSAEQELLG